jgi:ribosomal protein L40E
METYKNQQYSESHRVKTKERIIYVMGDSCQICGYNKCKSALELHHLNPLSKDFAISGNVNLSWDNIIKELPKCILICANCHREVHENNSMNLISSFNEEKSNEITQQIYDLKHKKLFYCKDCGALISYGALTCRNCLKEQTKAKIPTREELKELIRNSTFVSIGKQFKVTDNAIKKWCIKYNLPSKRIDIKNINDEEWELI